MSSKATINARKFDNSVHRSWSAELIEKVGSLLLFRGVFDSEVVHPELGVIGGGTVSYEYYWLDQWYNVFRFHQPDGTLRNYYCNVNLPPRYDDGVLDYVDLDLDVLVWRDFRVELLDREDFENNAGLYGYSNEIRAGAENALVRLTELIERREFPFDFKDSI